MSAVKCESKRLLQMMIWEKPFVMIILGVPIIPLCKCVNKPVELGVHSLAFL